MLKRTFDPTRPMRVALYLRMSSDHQNPRSPDQQRDTIEATVARLGHPWTVAAAYTDAGVSGRFVTRRADFQRLLRDIRTRHLKIDAILVDTFERFGRAEEMAGIRQELDRHHGVLVLTADTGFADPTSTAGKALAAFESMRATEDNRIKAHTVLRGKRDAARLKHWPGGPPPFGYRLQSVLVTRAGRQEVDHSVLVPDPATAWVVKTLFDKAHASGWGCSRLAKWLNADPGVPAEHKPFSAQTVNYWLARPIYKGELVWEVHATGVVDDRRVVEKNPDADVIRVPGFCEPLVDDAVWEKVREVRSARGQAVRRARTTARAGDGKQIAPLVPGVALVYPLSGLVVCGVCRLAMAPSSGGLYTLKESGATKRYVYYTCPRVSDGTCTNTTRVPEGWLRAVVVGLVRDRLFPLEPGATGWTADALSRTGWFGDLHRQVQAELDRLTAGMGDRRPAIEAGLKELTQRVQGWSRSLAHPDLNPAVRRVLEADLGAALVRADELQADLAALTSAAHDARTVADPATVADRLNRLAEVLGGQNPSRTNVELARHLDSVRCFPGGRVVVRTCKLGALAGAADLVGGPGRAVTGGTSELEGTPRRRGVRRLDTADAGPALREEAHRAADVHRFAGLGPDWFWEDEFRIPDPTCWSKENAAEVARLRVTMTHEQLAAHFGRSVPTIRKALRAAKTGGLLTAGLPRKMPRARWESQHFGEVADLRRQGRSLSELCTHFGKSEPLIRAALKLAARADPTSSPAADGPAPGE
ncbi:MAG: Resolvase domain protein [Gemmataceae bacterium]|nr:Resolvase domain protein [Gemmataceae bacterium]